jgi:hypothetical protein
MQVLDSGRWGRITKKYNYFILMYQQIKVPHYNMGLLYINVVLFLYLDSKRIVIFVIDIKLI